MIHWELLLGLCLTLKGEIIQSLKLQIQVNNDNYHQFTIVHCTLIMSYEGRACPGVNTLTCEGHTDNNGISWTTEAPTGTEQIRVNIYIPSGILNETETVSTLLGDTFFSGEILVNFNPINQLSLYTFNTTYSINTTLPATLTCSNSTDIGTVENTVIYYLATAQ